MPMATTFFFRASPPTASSRTGSSTGESDKLVARELRKQGLTPVYVGVEQKKRLRAQAAGVHPRQAARRSLLHAGAFHAAERRRAARPRPDHHQRTDRAPAFPLHRARYPARAQGRQVARRQPGARIRSISPTSTSTWCAPAKRRGSLAAVFERLAEFERSRDDLRGYIISSMIYPALLALVGVARSSCC